MVHIKIRIRHGVIIAISDINFKLDSVHTLSVVE